MASKTSAKTSPAKEAEQIADNVSDAKDSSKSFPPATKVHSVRPKKQTHFGRADAKRDSFLFVCFITFMLLVSYLFQDTSIPSDTNKQKEKLPSLSDMRKFKKLLEHSIEESMSMGFEADDDCQVFLGTSTLPNAGWGLFSGKRIESGHEILSPYQMGWPLWLNMTTFAMTTSDRSIFPSYSVIVKPHSILVNAKWSQTPIARISALGNSDTLQNSTFPTLVATKDILPGNELFVAWNDHPYQYYPQLFPSLPTTNHFQRANSIIQEALVDFKIQGEKLPRRRMSEITTGLKVLRKALMRYDVTVARILPSNAEQLLEYYNRKFTTELQSVKSRALSSVVTTSRCLTNTQWMDKSNMKGSHGWGADDYEVQHSPFLDAYAHGLIRDNVVPGQLIMPIPLLLLQTTDEESIAPSSDSDNAVCAASRGTPASDWSAICLLLTNGKHQTVGLSLCPINNVAVTTTDSKEANAEYQWSSNAKVHKQFLRKVLLDSETLMPATSEELHKMQWGMSWNVVALREITQNETIRVLGRPAGSDVTKWILETLK